MSRLSNTLTHLGRLLGIRPRALEEDEEHSTEQEQIISTTEELVQLEEWNRNRQAAWLEEIERSRTIREIRQSERYGRYNPDNPHYFFNDESRMTYVSNASQPIEWSVPTNRRTNISISASRINASNISAVHVDTGSYQQHTRQVQYIARKEKPPTDPHLPSL